MKIFKKSHLWKDNRTFLELEATEPKKERGFAKEGYILLKIGQQSNVKSAFKLSIDEARAIRDTIDMFLRFHDMKLSEYMTDQQEQFQKVPDYYQRDPEGVREDYSNQKQDNYSTNNYSKEDYSNSRQEDSNQTKDSAPLFLFGQSNETSEEEKEKQEKINSEFYF